MAAVFGLLLIGAQGARQVKSPVKEICPEDQTLIVISSDSMIDE
jgi:hypothetical protein